MLSRCRLIGLLTPRQLEILKTLADLQDQCGQTALWRPKDLGAFRSSHHTKTLQSLQERGFVEREAVGSGTRPTYAYRITACGQATLGTFRALVDIPLQALLGTQADRLRAQWAHRMAA